MLSYVWDEAEDLFEASHLDDRSLAAPRKLYKLLLLCAEKQYSKTEDRPKSDLLVDVFYVASEFYKTCAQ